MLRLAMRVYDLRWDLSQVAHRRRLSCLRFNWLRVQRVHAKVSYVRKRELTHTHRDRERKRERERGFVKTIKALQSRRSTSVTDMKVRFRCKNIFYPRQRNTTSRYITLRLLRRCDRVLLFTFVQSKTKRRNRKTFSSRLF